MRQKRIDATSDKKELMRIDMRHENLGLRKYLKVCLHEQCFSECLMRQPHPTPHKNRIIPIFGCGCRIRHSEKHCSCKQTIKEPHLEP
jgi:hypothetical protein